jgi:hypothetical protein
MSREEVTVISAWKGWSKSFKPRDCAAPYDANFLGLDLEIAFRTEAVYATFVTNYVPKIFIFILLYLQLNESPRLGL